MDELTGLLVLLLLLFFPWLVLRERKNKGENQHIFFYKQTFTIFLKLCFQLLGNFVTMLRFF